MIKFIYSDLKKKIFAGFRGLTVFSLADRCNAAFNLEGAHN